MKQDVPIKRDCIYCETGTREEVLRKIEPMNGLNGTIKTNLVIFKSKCCGGKRSIMPLSLAEVGAHNAN